MFKRVLVPLDGSKRAEGALPVAARLVRETNGSLVLVRVVSMATELWPYVDLETAHTQAVIEEELLEAARYLKSVTRMTQLEGIPVDTVTRHGPTASTILSVASSHGADLIAICSRSYTGMTRWVMGSMADKIARHSVVPVLVLRDGGPQLLSTDCHRTRPFRALVALDGSSRAMSALLPAASLTSAFASPERGTLHLARVVKPVINELDDGEQYPLDLRNSEQEVLEVTRYLCTTAEQLRAGHLGKLVDITWSASIDTDVARGIVRMGECNESLLKEGDRCNEFDLIAISTHGHGGIHNPATGSTPQRVLNATSLPLLLVHPADGVKTQDCGLEYDSLTTIGEMQTIHTR